MCALVFGNWNPIIVRLWKLIHSPLCFHQQSHFHPNENPSCLPAWCYSWLSVRPRALTLHNLSTISMQRMGKQQISVNVSVIWSKCRWSGHFLSLRWGIAFPFSLMCIFTRLCIYRFKRTQRRRCYCVVLHKVGIWCAVPRSRTKLYL